MLWFWILTVAMILFGLGFVIPPLLSKKVAASVASDELNIAIYRQKLAELDRNEENLDEEQLKLARQEMEQGLLQDVDSQPDHAPATPLQPKTRLMVAAIVAVMLPLAALLLYAELSPKQWTQMVEYDPAMARTAVKAKANLPSIDEMVTRLEAKLQKNPTDPKGWALLGRSYFIMGRYNEAANSYAQANKLSGEKDIDILADYAESLAMADNGKLQGKVVGQLLTQALSLQPRHPKSLWLAGSAAFQAGKYKNAIRHWGSLLEMHPDKSNEGAQVLQKQIAEARARLGDDGGKTSPPVAQKPSMGKTVVKVSVKLDDALKAKASPTDTVFIFARAVQGPPMPLAIVKKQVKDLPITVSLNDAMAMMPKMSMSSFKQIYIGVRVSKTGNATPQSGDLQGHSTPISTGKAQKVKITINQEVL